MIRVQFAIGVFCTLMQLFIAFGWAIKGESASCSITLFTAALTLGIAIIKRNLYESDYR